MRSEVKTSFHANVFVGVLVFVVLLAFGTPANAEAKPVACGPLKVESSTVNVTGLLSDTDSFVQTFRITATKDAMPEFEVAGDLTTKNDRRIARTRIDVTNPGALKPKKSATVKVTVKAVRFAGEYRGELRLRGSKCRLTLIVTASATPELGLVGAGSDKKVQLDLTRCKRWTCGGGDFADFLVVKERRPPQVSVLVDKRSSRRGNGHSSSASTSGRPGRKGCVR